jgi:hypothetical protein
MEGKTTDVKKIMTFFDNERDGISIQGLTALSPYDYGLNAGKLFKAQYRFLNHIVHIFDKRNIDNVYIETQRKNIEQYLPFFSEELNGLSKSTNLDVDTLLYLQNKLCSLFYGQCTIGLATGNATKNNETFLIFNLDGSVESAVEILLSTILHRMISLKCWIVRICTMEYKYAFWGFPVLFEYPFLNEKGLGWGSPGTIFTDNESRYVDEGPGVSTWGLEKLAMMTCKNVSEVARLYMDTERASEKGNGWFHIYDGSSSSFCDREGGILIIEQTHQYILTVFGNSTEITGGLEGILWHANHHQWLDPNLTGSVYPNEYPSSGLRAERMRELLTDSYGNITLEICKNIARDHGGGFDSNGKDSGDICRHPDNSSLKVTAFSWIIMPKDLTVFWTHTSPCKGIFFRHDFSQIFDS